ncbi:hypothetical protein [Stenotrophomonas sp. BIGb0135]|uniref:hypothetical protein n=1 Tax=Stenotrophomonas sp. BIGb0135 TaxID=2940620 RepID=UPI002168B61F|nr:hypothetical protein [Stenotrophomonas sp. BIGb0135]MCS4234455.1 hypothetical protein [Stenotrophomonas sp. BIGb0135]
MTSKHTPGPWHLDETFVDGKWGNPSHWICEVVGPDNSRIVADIPEYRTYEEDTAELEANARLIAAAPELLGALADLLDVYRRGAQGFPLTYELCKVIEEQAANAIAKATGEA